MNAIPAIVAGVKRIVISVPAVNGKLNPLILACANLLGIDEIYKVGSSSNRSNGVWNKKNKKSR